jgi:hypothetical protein
MIASYTAAEQRAASRLDTSTVPSIATLELLLGLTTDSMGLVRPTARRVG